MNEIETIEILAEGSCFKQDETEIVIKVNNIDVPNSLW